MVKRLTDVVISGLALLLLGVPMLLIALSVRIALGAPVLFRSTRPGMNGRSFTMYKFRTMTDARHPTGAPLPDEERLTRFGRFLRSTSLDELPELINVLRGDMSIVGPRPLLPEYLGRYTPEQARRHEVRPGITGLAQVRGRNDTEWEQRLEYDVWYVDNRTLALDFKIIAETVGKVVKREGVSAPGHATMPEFQGPDGE